MLRLGKPAVHIKVSDARRKKMFLPLTVRCVGKRNHLLAFILQKYRSPRLRGQIFRNKYVDGGKQYRKDKQHRAQHGKGDISSYMLHFEPPSDRRR